MSVILTIQAVDAAAIFVLTIAGRLTLRRVLRSLDGMAGALASILRLLAGVEFRLRALESSKKGGDPHAHLIDRGQMRGTAN
jgi:hypothetical protein